jgi:hypothetical protein
MAKKNEGSTAEKKKTTQSVDLQKFLKEIEKKAYDLYQNRLKTNSPGDEFSDWLKAEAGIKTKYELP